MKARTDGFSDGGSVWSAVLYMDINGYRMGLNTKECFLASVNDAGKTKCFKGNLQHRASYKQVRKALKINGFKEKLARNLQQNQAMVK